MTSRSVLLIAFHFPPLRGISGIQRTLCFAKYLPDFGWNPIVLTVTPSAYKQVGPIDLFDTGSPFEVHRVRAFDAAKDLSLFGRYPRWLALPDRWMSWRFFAIHEALKTIRARQVDLIWSSFPIATAHKIGISLAQRTGLPWVAEFRDPMWQGDYPPDPVVNRTWRELEVDIFGRADQVIVTTPGAAALYAHRFPDFDRSRLMVIENGYDEDEFLQAEASLDQHLAIAPGKKDQVTLLHSGVIYPSERDPSQLFAALASMKSKQLPAASRLRIVLRATGHDARYAQMLKTLDIQDIVKIEPSINYPAALQEMLTADGLLLLQASNCNAQIPAKLYEYLRSRRPIIAFTDPAGDTARALRAAGAGFVAPLDSATAIEHILIEFLAQSDAGNWGLPGPAVVQKYSRRSQTEQLAKLLDNTLRRRD